MPFKGANCKLLNNLFKLLVESGLYKCITKLFSAFLEEL